MHDRRSASRLLIAAGTALAVSSFFLAVTAPETLRLTRAAMRTQKPRTTGLEARSVDRGWWVDDALDAVPPLVSSFLAKTPGDNGPYAVRVGDDSQLDVSLTNVYTRVSPIETGHHAYPWRYVAEPFRPTTLSVENPDPDATRYKWFVDGHEQGYGPTVGVAWTKVGWRRLALAAVRDGNVTWIGVHVMVKYVRREIRSMTDRDRETFFDAAMMIQRIPTEVGQKLYGSKYRSKDSLNRMHMYYGGRADCDHWHQGAGFVTSHVALTLAFEQSLQSVFPQVTTPYWDFTIESTFYDATTWRQSPVFADDWFGMGSPDNDLHTVTRGRWSFVPVMTRAWNFSKVHNSYGLLRAPWNNDPTPFMTRFRQVYGLENNIKPSGCREYSVAMKKTSWMSMSRQLNSAAHGHIHETVGGSWNHDVDWNNGPVQPAVLTFAHEIQALSKDLWRAGYVECPDFCSMDTPWRDCQCQCTQASLAGKESYDILADGGVLNAVTYYDQEGHLIRQWTDAVNGTVTYTLPGYNDVESKHIYDQLLKVLCSPGHIGDMYQASSTNDITFWVLHPTVDRLWHFKRLGNLAHYDETWDPYHTCYGHNPTDYQPFKNLFDTNDHFYTNNELYELLRPDDVMLPYMYDNFKWPHCELLGYGISNDR